MTVVEYQSGSAGAVVTGTLLLLSSLEPEHPVLARCYQIAIGTGDVDAVIAALLTVYDQSFVLVSEDADQRRVVVRGNGQLTVDPDGPAERCMSADGFLSDTSDAAQPSVPLRLTLENASGPATIPLAQGIVGASAVLRRPTSSVPLTAAVAVDQDEAEWQRFARSVTAQPAARSQEEAVEPHVADEVVVEPPVAGEEVVEPPVADKDAVGPPVEDIDDGSRPSDEPDGGDVTAFDAWFDGTPGASAPAGLDDGHPAPVRPDPELSALSKPVLVEPRGDQAERVEPPSSEPTESSEQVRVVDGSDSRSAALDYRPAAILQPPSPTPGASGLIDAVPGFSVGRVPPPSPAASVRHAPTAPVVPPAADAASQPRHAQSTASQGASDDATGSRPHVPQTPAPASSATVAESDPEPSPTPVVPVAQPVGPSPVSVDNISLTVNRASLREAAAQAPRPTVIARRCVNGHLTPAYGASCRVCRGAIVPDEPIEMQRPVLGRLVIDGSRPVILERAVVLGRNPSGYAIGAGPVPHLIQLNDPRGEVSSVHALVTMDGWNVEVTDLGSTNGTEVITPSGERTTVEPHTPYVIQPGGAIVLAEILTIGFEAEV